jgi:putative endonuclease
VSLQKGLLAEDFGVQYLQLLEFAILERNIHSRYGEIDIVAMKDSILHFIEVKSGRNFNPIQNMSERKLHRIVQTIEIYLQDRPQLLKYSISIDLLSIKGSEIEFIENITI